jgi:hypothetical protein
VHRSSRNFKFFDSTEPRRWPLSLRRAAEVRLWPHCESDHPLIARMRPVLTRALECRPRYVLTRMTSPAITDDGFDAVLMIQRKRL